MSARCFAVLSLLVFLTGAGATAQSIARRTVVLSEEGQVDVPELVMGPELVTTVFFGAPLRLVGAEVEDEEHFSRVTRLEDALLLVPSPAIEAGRKLRLRVRFVEGTRPSSADFLLVVDPTRTESHQVNVDLRRPSAERCGQEVEAERLRTQQCQTALESARRQPQELTGLLVSGLMDNTGVITRILRRKTFTQRAGAPLQVIEGSTYRAVKRVAVDLWVTNHSGRSWNVTGAELVEWGGERLRVLRVWPGEPLASGAKKQRIVVEAEAASTKARGRYVLSLWQEGEPPSVVMDGVVFP